MGATFTRSPLPLTEHRGLYHIYRLHRLPCHRGMGTSRAKAADTAKSSSDWPKFRPIRQAIQYLSGTTIPPGKRRQRGVSPTDRLGPDQAALPVAIGRPATTESNRGPPRRGGPPAVVLRLLADANRVEAARAALHLQFGRPGLSVALLCRGRFQAFESRPFVELIVGTGLRSRGRK